MIRRKNQVFDLESSARSGPLTGGGGGGSLTLLGDAEEVLVKSWQAFGAANTAVLELVELQNPLPAPGSGGGSGTVTAGGDDGGGMLLRRYCCFREVCFDVWSVRGGTCVLQFGFTVHKR